MRAARPRRGAPRRRRRARRRARQRPPRRAAQPPRSHLRSTRRRRRARSRRGTTTSAAIVRRSEGGYASLREHDVRDEQRQARRARSPSASSRARAPRSRRRGPTASALATADSRNSTPGATRVTLGRLRARHAAHGASFAGRREVSRSSRTGTSSKLCGGGGEVVYHSSVSACQGSLPTRAPRLRRLAGR